MNRHSFIRLSLLLLLIICFFASIMNTGFILSGTFPIDNKKHFYDKEEDKTTVIKIKKESVHYNERDNGCTKIPVKNNHLFLKIIYEEEDDWVYFYLLTCNVANISLDGSLFVEITMENEKSIDYEENRKGKIHKISLKKLEIEKDYCEKQRFAKERTDSTLIKPPKSVIWYDNKDSPVINSSLRFKVKARFFESSLYKNAIAKLNSSYTISDRKGDEKKTEEHEYSLISSINIYINKNGLKDVFHHDSNNTSKNFEEVDGRDINPHFLYIFLLFNIEYTLFSFFAFFIIFKLLEVFNRDN